MSNHEKFPENQLKIEKIDIKFSENVKILEMLKHDQEIVKKNRKIMILSRVIDFQYQLPLKTARRIETRMIYNVQSTSMHIIHLNTKHTSLLLVNMGWCRYVLNMLNHLYNLNVLNHVYTIGVSTIKIPYVPYSNMLRENVLKGSMV